MNAFPMHPLFSLYECCAVVKTDGLVSQTDPQDGHSFASKIENVHECTGVGWRSWSGAKKQMRWFFAFDIRYRNRGIGVYENFGTKRTKSLYQVVGEGIEIVD